MSRDRGSLVVIERLDGRLQGGLGCKDGRRLRGRRWQWRRIQRVGRKRGWRQRGRRRWRACAQAGPIISSGEYVIARPSATDEQLVYGGQVVCVLSKSKGGLTKQAACGLGGGRWGGAVAMHGGADCWARHARGMRTRNIESMVVTLDVSKLSGWLKADASCQCTRRHMEGDPGVGGGRVRGSGGGARSVHGGEPSRHCGHGKRAGGAHLKHGVHVRDSGRFDAQRLVERVRALPGHTEARRGRLGGLGGARACGGGGGARSMHGGTGWALVTARARGCAPETCSPCQ